MIDLPDFDKPWDYENGFYLSAQPNRLAKQLAHYELYKMTRNLPGAIVECGVFKGVSFARLAMFRDLFENTYSKKIIGFDTFAEFPEPENEADQRNYQQFTEAAGSESISVTQLHDVLDNKGLDENIELIEGDIIETVEMYVRDNPELKISFLNLDVDIYEPSAAILEHLYPRVVPGGVVLLDDYGTFPGETRAVDEYFGEDLPEIHKFPFATTPCYIEK